MSKMVPNGAVGLGAFVSLAIVALAAAASTRDLDGSLSGDVSDPASQSPSTAVMVFTTFPAEAADHGGALGEDDGDDNAGGDDDNDDRVGEEGDRTVRFCNKSSTFTLKTDCKPCALNARVACPSGLWQLTEGRGTPDCNFAQRLDFVSVIYIAGCRHTCEKTITITFCCSGFWGPDCQGTEVTERYKHIIVIR